MFYGISVNSGIGGCESASPKFEKYFALHKNETYERHHVFQKAAVAFCAHANIKSPKVTHGERVNCSESLNMVYPPEFLL